MIGVTTSIILDTRTMKKDGTFAVKLRLTYNREQKYYPINIHLTSEDWKKTLSSKPRQEFKEHRLYFNKIEERAVDIIKNLQPFSFEGFEKKFDQRPDRSKDVFSYFNAYIQLLNNEKRIGTAASYQCAHNSFKKYIVSKNRKKLHFEDVTPELLINYEKWMVEEDNSSSTSGIYARCLRTMYNMAIENGVIARDFYPFGKRKYKIPGSRNVKKALALPEIEKLIKYKPVNEAEERARDFYIFSYLCNGANIKDIAKLQFKNISSSSITFIREKTKRATKQNSKPVIAMMLPEIKNIINKWGVNTSSSNDYIFQIINDSDDDLKQFKKIQQATKTINKYMKRIGEKLGISTKLTTYTARHSFATVLKRSGASTEFISESLGHADIHTTENYLDSFENNQRLEFQKQLLNFNSVHHQDRERLDRSLLLHHRENCKGS
ncbi:MAG: site-specific integrase [Bacteroidetes bacterium]|nr:site-specific integrase [Bacteroidota bacterium]